MSQFEDVFATLRGRRVLVTGHTGFKGSWLTAILCELGADVTGFALAPTPPVSHFKLLGLHDQIHHVVGDICDSAHLTWVLEQCQPEIVFHLAAQALVRPSYDDPGATFATNVMGSTNVLEAVRNCESVRSLVYVTSDKCYENVEWVWGYRETDALGGRDPYSASKAAAELVFSSYQRSFFAHRVALGAASARAGNVIGGGDWAVDRIIPDCIRSIQAGNPVKLRNPQATRPWQHVLEPLSGYLLLAARLYNDPQRWSGAWNFGPATHDVKTVSTVAKAITEQMERGSIEIESVNTRMHEAGLLQLNCDKAHQLLGWTPRWSANETLKHTALWYKAWLDGASMSAVTRQQIRQFFPELS